MKPLADRVLIENDPEEEVSAGGILLPRGENKQTVTGKVIAVGPGKYSSKTGKLIPLTVKVGDKVVCMKYAAKHNEQRNSVASSEPLTLIKEEDILMILED